MSIIISGDPIRGLTFYGPFYDDCEAMEWAEGHFKIAAWWVVTLERP